MKHTMKTAVVGLAALLGALLPSDGQTAVQNLSFSLVAYNETNGIVRPVRITTRDVIRMFASTNVPRSNLLLVSPAGPPATADNLGASLRVTSGGETAIDVTSPDFFNLFQDSASISHIGNRTITYALNRFSIDFGEFHAELQGFTVWFANLNTPGGEGSFQSTVNGWCVIDGVTANRVPVRGTIIGWAPRPGT